MKVISAKEFEKNTTLTKMVEPENDLKNMLVEYVGGNLNPENNEVTVEMVVEIMAKEFPEFLLAVAEENWVRGYQQALEDIDVGYEIAKENDKQRKNCKLCEKSE